MTISHPTPPTLLKLCKRKFVSFSIMQCLLNFYTRFYRYFELCQRKIKNTTKQHKALLKSNRRVKLVVFIFPLSKMSNLHVEQAM
jgi:hypothetical protein